jgi:hypothetical protein
MMTYLPASGLVAASLAAKPDEAAGAPEAQRPTTDETPAIVA